MDLAAHLHDWGPSSCRDATVEALEIETSMRRWLVFCEKPVPAVSALGTAASFASGGFFLVMLSLSVAFTVAVAEVGVFPTH